jgi:hypothetical protein
LLKTEPDLWEATLSPIARNFAEPPGASREIGAGGASDKKFGPTCRLQGPFAADSPMRHNEPSCLAPAHQTQPIPYNRFFN